MVFSACSPVNGGRPDNRSNKTAPKLYTSAAAVSLLDPFTCSGAMNNSLLVRVLHRTRHFGHERNCATRIAAQCSSCFEQTAAAGKLHAEEGQPVVAFAYFINWQNVRMIEVRRSLSFAPEAHQGVLRISVVR